MHLVVHFGSLFLPTLLVYFDLHEGKISLVKALVDDNFRLKVLEFSTLPKSEIVFRSLCEIIDASQR